MRRFAKAPYLIIGLFFLSMGIIISCRHEDQIIESANATYTRSDAVFLPGNMTIGNTNEWKLDKVHSNVMWSTNYMGAAGLLTGRFNQFGMAKITNDLATNYVTTGQPVKDKDWAFYENDPSKSFFNGYVQINTSNTGEPGRDGGCNITNLGTVAIVSGTQNLTPTNLAKIETTKIEFDPASAGYIVTMNFTFKGKLAEPKTISIPGKLTYVKRKTVALPNQAPYDVFGLQLKFQFNCRDFSVDSPNVSDKIDIECNMNFNNK